jgi:acyl carrier protein
MTDTATRVRAIITDHLCVEADRVQADAHLVDDLGADSLDQVELTMAMEEEFGTEITDDEAESCTTVGNWIDLIADKTGEPA